MFRVPAVLSKTRICILRVRSNPDLQPQCAAFSITPINKKPVRDPCVKTPVHKNLNYKKVYQPERDPCAKIPPPPPPRRSYKFLFRALALLAMTGAFAVFAKQNNQVRDWLSIYMPWFDDLIAVLYQENMSYLQFIICTATEFQDQMNNFKESCVKGKTVDEMQLEEEQKSQPKSCAGQGKVQAKGGELQAKGGEEQISQSKYCAGRGKVQAKDGEVQAKGGEEGEAAEGGEGNENEEETNEEGEIESELTPEKCSCDNLRPPFVIKDICEIENCIRELGDIAVNNYFTAKEACVYYNKIVSEAMLNYTYAKTGTLQEERETRIQLVEKHVAKAEEAENMIEQVQEEMGKAIECNVEVQKKPEKIEKTVEALNDIKAKIKRLKIELMFAQDRAEGMDAVRQSVEKAADKYAGDVKAMYPEVDYKQERPKIDGDIDMLLRHTIRSTKKVQKDLEGPAEAMTGRVDRAVELLEDKDKDKIIKAAISKKQADQKKLEDEIVQGIKNETDKETKRLMKEADERHAKALEQKLADKEAEVMVNFTKNMGGAVGQQRQQCNQQLKEMSDKLAAVRHKFNEQVKTDHERKRSKKLYEASTSILAKCHTGQPVVDVSKEFDIIEKNKGFCDDFMTSIVKAIPESARKGVVPEIALRSRYRQMEEVAMKVSMVEGDGSPLPIYGISLFQYMLLSLKPSFIPQAEKDTPPEEPFTGLDTFDLLQRARYYMDRGNLAQAARYVGALKGASRGAANQWYNDTKLHLETRQLAEAVQAHAAALGLKYM